MIIRRHGFQRQLYVSDFGTECFSLIHFSREDKSSTKTQGHLYLHLHQFKILYCPSRQGPEDSGGLETRALTTVCPLQGQILSP